MEKAGFVFGWDSVSVSYIIKEVLIKHLIRVNKRSINY